MTPAEIVDSVAALQNDVSKSEYNYDAVYPYLNMALLDLQRIFQLNNIPVTDETTSPAIPINAGVNLVSWDTIPALPIDLISIRQLWESPRNLNQWTPVTRKDFIPHYLEDNTLISQFLLWSNKDGVINVIPANVDNDLKIDYIKKLFPKLTTNNSDFLFSVQIEPAESYLNFRTAAICSMFIGENETRASALQDQAEIALLETMGISIKGQQTMPVRRRPYRASYKARGPAI